MYTPTRGGVCMVHASLDDGICCRLFYFRVLLTRVIHAWSVHQVSCLVDGVLVMSVVWCGVSSLESEAHRE